MPNRPEALKESMGKLEKILTRMDDHEREGKPNDELTPQKPANTTVHNALNKLHEAILKNFEYLKTADEQELTELTDLVEKLVTDQRLTNYESNKVDNWPEIIKKAIEAIKEAVKLITDTRAKINIQ